MKSTSRWMVLGLGLAAVVATGCIITSAQILAHFDLPNPVHLNGSDDWERVPVDLAVEVGSDYSDNKDKLQGVTDLAVLGTFTNTGNQSGQVSVYITAGNTNYGAASEITANGTLLWGPAAIGPARTAVGGGTVGLGHSAAPIELRRQRIPTCQAEGGRQVPT